MAKRISELTRVTSTPPNPNCLVEVAEPNLSAPSGFVSKSVTLGSISGQGGGLTHRFYFSGTTGLSEDNTFTCGDISYDSLDALVNPDLEVMGRYDAATIDVSLSVRGSDNGIMRSGAGSARISYARNDYTNMKYQATGGLHDGGQFVSLPYYIPDYFGSVLPPIVVNTSFDDADRLFNLVIGIATNNYNNLPPQISYSGYMDITIVPSLIEF